MVSMTVTMTENRTAPVRFHLNARQAIAGALLMGAGGLVGVAGAALAASSFVLAFRRHLKQLDMPASAYARQNLTRMKTATAAGVGAWRDAQAAAQLR
jgi:hypothetical protein